jgi:hypothetical protein
MMSGSDRLESRNGYAPRLIVYVVWHPKFTRGEELADALYSQLSRDVRRPTSRGIGIPVYFRSTMVEGNGQLPRPILLGQAQRTAVIVLVDVEMVLGEGWDGYIAGLCKEAAESPSHRVFPVAFSDTAYNLHPEVAASNFVRLQRVEPSKQARRLCNTIIHELCRMLLNQPRMQRVESNGINDATGSTAGQPVGEAADKMDASPPPVTLFISHAKVDGLAIAESLRGYVDSQLSLKTFFDANDIPAGSLFGQEIKANVERTALVVINSDAYASREWCQNEVLWAKRSYRPVVVVNAIREGERRSFPYSGNVPTIRWDSGAVPETSEAVTAKCEAVVGAVLQEVLRHTYFQQHSEDIVKLYGIREPAYVLPNPPELLTCLMLKAKHQQDRPEPLIIYPDPPLGTQELRLLNDFDAGIRLTTLSMLPLLENRS